eukprot:scaffold157387_cov30-Tisochrysis_lutea.AAC.2
MARGCTAGACIRRRAPTQPRSTPAGIWLSGRAREARRPAKSVCDGRPRSPSRDTRLSRGGMNRPRGSHRALRRVVQAQSARSFL